MLNFGLEFVHSAASLAFRISFPAEPIDEQNPSRPVISNKVAFNQLRLYYILQFLFARFDLDNAQESFGSGTNNQFHLDIGPSAMSCDLAVHDKALEFILESLGKVLRDMVFVLSVGLILLPVELIVLLFESDPFQRLQNSNMQIIRGCHKSLIVPCTEPDDFSKRRR